MVLSAHRRAYPEGPFRTAHARLVDEGLVDDRESWGLLSKGESEEICRDQRGAFA
ncbi:hypothetical protein RB628_38000 [Streptomyces sp. ADMS]|uniref:hypothetical protein n=1 Tax=Streptomyces sp. ADMS TaxID=3071415 RepID=UPI00296EBA76|nr:hypothetical protein [Streptomyces sp. ADMS]MDW4910960.1 hypothetical protein [Streptomyces sp. ADMS]